jgi:hypothetical protein
MRTLLILLISILRSGRALFRSREEQAIVEFALRQQLAVYSQDRPRPRLSPLDRAFWVALSRLWPLWKGHLVVVRPETVVRWVIQQLRETFPDEPSHRFIIYDNDSIFSSAVAGAIRSFEIDPKRTAFRSPWQNGTAERFVGTVRRELLDHVVVLNDEHLRRLLHEYVDYYNAERVHTSIGDAPVGRPVESQLSNRSKILGFPRVGGLHHRYH